MKKPSMRKCVDEMCKQCIYDPIGGFGTWRAQVAACLDSRCPLHPIRPLNDGEKHEWQAKK